jgi:hypothetical protein
VPDTHFLLLHFTGVSLPGNNRIEIQLGYDTDIFTSADRTSFWTRPINTKALNGAPIVVSYITSGAATGQAQIDTLGVGERHAGSQDETAVSNCDPFLSDASYTEPQYDPFWFCNPPPNWENVACVTDPNDVRSRVARSVGMIITPDSAVPMQYQNPSDQYFGLMVLSTCSVTLIDADVVLLAGHCFDTDADAVSSSVTFDYETDCTGNRLPNYNPKFYKVKELITRQYVKGDIPDWAVLRLASAPPGIPPIQLRADIPKGDDTTNGNGERVFGIHHPNGAVKKLSVPHPGFDRVLASSADGITIPNNFAVSGGSSGSGLFDTAGRLVGVLSNGLKCGTLDYYPSAVILQNIAPAPPNPVTRDVMVVFDRSGSMLQQDSTRRTKIEVAKDAVSLFVQLIRSGVGNRLGLVSFSTTAKSPVDFTLTGLDDNAKTTLIGAAPYAGGTVGGLSHGGSTSIGDGLKQAIAQLPDGGPGSNPRAILLMTDGMENTPPSISDEESSLDSIAVHAVGFGTTGNLDGKKLTHLTANHQGLYTQAETGVSLMKFFSHAFGNIFETGILKDPEFTLGSAQNVAPPFRFNVCKEDALTVAVGWDDIQGSLRVNLTTPNGITIGGSSAQVQQSVGRAWAFIRVPLPYGGEQMGQWNVTVYRPPPPVIPTFLRVFIRQASPPPPPALRYFVNVIPTGGPTLTKVTDHKTYYTGDVINPRVFFSFSDGSWPDQAKVELTLSRPNASIGNILSTTGLRAPISISGDTIPSRQATLQDIGAVIGQVDETITLGTDTNDSGGFFEETGVFGKVLNGSLTVDGDYLFHFQAATTNNCQYSRETLWSLHVDVGIDPSTTTVSVSPSGNGAGVVIITPSDPYGNKLGPGQGDGFTVSGANGTTVTGPPIDLGNGSYSVPISNVPPTGGSGGIIITQPGRGPVTIPLPETGASACRRCVASPADMDDAACDITAPCSNTPFGTMCGCRPGYRANAADNNSSVHWRLTWPVPGHEHRVYVAPGWPCDTLCEQWWLGATSCQEVSVSTC